jgi:hypothetical protein
MKLTCQNASRRGSVTRKKTRARTLPAGVHEASRARTSPAGVHATRKPSQRALPRELALVAASVIPLSKPYASCQRRRVRVRSAFWQGLAVSTHRSLVYLFGLLTFRRHLVCLFGLLPNESDAFAASTFSSVFSSISRSPLPTSLMHSRLQLFSLVFSSISSASSTASALSLLEHLPLRQPQPSLLCHFRVVGWEKWN